MKKDFLDDDARLLEMILHIIQANRPIERHIYAHLPPDFMTNLNMFQAQILQTIAKNDCKMKISEIARVLNVSRQRMTNPVNALMEKGLITKSHENGDKKSVYLSLTPRTEELINEGRANCVNVLRPRLKFLGTAAAYELEAAFMAIYDILSRLDKYDDDCDQPIVSEYDYIKQRAGIETMRRHRGNAS